ncbi:uncharacterized protein BROUX77_002249 [Berkeleyomyces rouxiae]|uniref:uncharacterized protein n=1 Tax=Berkeleyomyces rouxiae TaxID=2035830 RepID=UPI003B825DCC
MSRQSRPREPSRSSQRSKGRTNDLRDFETVGHEQPIKDFEPCAATSSMFLYAQGSTIICCRHQSLAIERRFTRHSEAVQLLAVDNISQQGSGRLVASYDAGQTAIVWDLATGEEIARFASYDHLTTAAWMKNGNIAFGNIQGHVIQFEPGTSEHSSTRTLSQIPITALAVANDSTTFAIGYQNGTLLVATLGERFNVLHTLTTNRTPSPLVTLQWHSSTPQQKSIMLAAQTRDGDLRVWSVPKSTHGGTPIPVRILSKSEQNFTPGPNWMSWSKNGRIIQYSDNETLSWDVRTRHVTRDPIPTAGKIRGIAIYGAGASLFTLGVDSTVQQFDLNAPSVLVANIQHPAQFLPPSPPVSIEEVDKGMVSNTSESEMPSNPSDIIESEEDLEGYDLREAAKGRGYSDMESIGFSSAQSSQPIIDNQSKTVSIPRGNNRSQGGKSDHTYISTGSHLKHMKSSQKLSSRHYNPVSRIPDFQSQSSLNTASTRSRMRPDRSRSKSRGETPREPAKFDIFKYTRTRLDDVPYRHPPINDSASLTNDDLRRQMLNTIFGWNGEVEELILDEMTRHPQGSSVRIILSKWIGQETSEDEIMASADLMSSSDWMLLALGGIGNQPSQQKLGRAYITKLLEQGDLHAAVTIMLGMGDYIDAIEVYHSHKHYMEALILACLYMPSVWERQSAIAKKWGEWAVQHGHQKLAIRCFTCTERESTEPWASPSAMQLNFQPLGPNIFSPPLSPPSTTQGPSRGIAKTSALKLITTFGEPGERKKFFADEDLDSKTPIANGRGLNPIGIDYEDADPTTAILRPSNNSAFATPTSTSMRSNASGTSGYSSKRLSSIGELSADAKRLDPVNRHATRTQAPPEPDSQRNLSSGISLARAATASPMMMHDNYRRLTHEQPLPSPGASLSQKMEMLHSRNASRNAYRDQINRFQLNIDTTKATNTSDDQSTTTFARYHWPRRRGPNSVSSATSASTSRSTAKHAAKSSLDSHIFSLDAISDRRQANRQSSRERRREPSLDRGRTSSRNYPAKRSPRSPIPMSPEDLVSLKASSSASIDVTVTTTTPSHKVYESSRASSRSNRNRSRSRTGNMADRGIPLTINTMQILAQVGSTRREIKSPISPAPMSSSLQPNLVNSEDEKDYQMAMADQEKFRRARSASRGPSRKTPDSSRQTNTEQVRVLSPDPNDRSVLSRMGSRERAGDLRIIKEERQQKKEAAARELEERRKELVNNTKLNAIPHPNDLPVAESIPRPSTSNEMAASYGRDIPRSFTADPYNAPRTHQSSGVGLPATPKAMRLVQDFSQLKGYAPVASQTSTKFLQPFSRDQVKDSSGSLTFIRNIEVAPGPATATLPTVSIAQESLTLLPSTVYQPPSKGIPRCQSAPIPDEPSFLHRRENSRQHERPRKNSHSSRQEYNKSTPPVVLKELQHLVSPKPPNKTLPMMTETLSPPPPPPPPPMGHTPASSSALASGMIEIVKEDEPVHSARHKVHHNAPVTVPPSDFMVPVLSPPVPPLRGQTRGRSATDSSISGRLNKATERLRSASRTRKDAGRREGQSSAQDAQGHPSYEGIIASAQYLRATPPQQSQALPLPTDLDSLPTGMKKNEFF